MRLFISAEFHDRAKKRLEKCGAMLREAGVRGGYVPSVNYHITLAFIGETNDADAVCRAVSQVSFHPVGAEFGYFGNFGNIDWISPFNTDDLTGLSGVVRKELADRGIRFDEKPFMPHVTLIRKARHPEQFVFPRPERFSVTVGRIGVIRSILTPEGAEYAEIYVKDLY